jgi:imidazolonepropionase
VKVVIKNISELVTLDPLAQEKRGCRVTEKDLGIIADAWLAIERGKIAGFGAMTQIPKWAADTTVVDADNAVVLPGLIDNHTHPIFAGSRHHEFTMRLSGKTYQEIAEAGGGIKFTVAATQKASDAELEDLVRSRFFGFLAKGVTTIEAKSGYGLLPREELRELGILHKVATTSPQTVITTCLPLHARPAEYKSNKDFVKATIRELLPEVARQGLAQYVDAFIENGYFSADDCDEYMEASKSLGLKIRIHADEFSDAGAALAAAKWGAASADHLQFASDEGIERMAASGVVATLLPGTSLYTGIPFANAKRFLSRGCAVALATDFNPGSCLIDNLPMVAALGAIHCGLSLAQAVAAVTYVPALSLDLGHRKGALAEGFDADFLIFPGDSASAWLADMGRTRPREVWINGQRVVAGSTVYS